MIDHGGMKATRQGDGNRRNNAMVKVVVAATNKVWESTVAMTWYQCTDIRSIGRDGEHGKGMTLATILG